MLAVDENGWKRAVEGMRRGDVGPFKQQNSISGVDGIREYFDGQTCVMRMRVVGSETVTPAYECTRVFQITIAVRDATDYIYIPTQADVDADGDGELDLMELIQQKEAE